eukprot:CAMPEP_0179041366 /NCGR_PEP_ID=MMETSP0796-20121207/16119_1 /TAXON_ID=73915 /ORGANISM="Pyrodinium bahamense, Strain pbaha01" /LENGTH=392 /DNA_ID=CAMNT_0020737727 /DNA_START=72 /DNA_END=1247 /DNA_ORIENTATION=-
MAASLHGDVASAIGQQVEQMIMQAKKDSEARVSHDLSAARAQLQDMESLIGDLTDRVARCARAHGPGAPDPSQTVDQAFLKQNIEHLEQKWGSEVKALKQDLHRTILAHNHNSDLMRHHRDALDEARRRLDAQTQPKAEQVDAQIEKVDRMLRQGQAKQRALDALTERLAALEQQVAELLPNPPMPGPFPGMMPGMPRMNPMMAQTPMAQQRGEPKRAGAGGGKKDGELEEELRARFLQATRAGQASAAGDGGATSFNAEAPVFVPRSAPAATDAAAATGAAAAAGGATGAAAKADAPSGGTATLGAAAAADAGAAAAAAGALVEGAAGSEEEGDAAEVEAEAAPVEGMPLVAATVEVAAAAGAPPPTEVAAPAEAREGGDSAEAAGETEEE